MERVLIGVDAGTTNIKTAAFTLGGEELTKTTRETPLETPRAGWVEQGMETTWERTAATIRETVDALDDAEVVAIGVTGQGDGCWLIDDEGKPVREAILWSDGRAAEYVTDWKEDGTAERVRQITGSDLFPGAALPILQWLADNEPETIADAETAFFCKDWIKYRLTGERTMDYSGASLPFLDIDSLSYSTEIPELADVPGLTDMLPRLVPGTDVIGTLTADAAEETGLPAETPVVSGLIDVVASAIGCGAVAPGDSSSVVGTTSLNQSFLSEPPAELQGHGFTIALFEGLYSRVMASMAGTPNLDWALAELTPDWEFERAERAARSAPATAGGLLYHPYLSTSGERSPFNDPYARGQFVGLSPNHDREHLLRAVYEGVALAMRDCYEHIDADADRIRMSGGGARSDLWCQLFADCLDAEIAVPAGEEFGARGVALLAGVGAGAIDDLEDTVRETTTYESVNEPRETSVPIYDEWYETYRETYEGMRDLWQTRTESIDRLQAETRLSFDL
ncbi:FGGY-family carbohydrate kinase [Halobellus ordinarius]|uniref:FGGY-family carbohydrate kinase n=1 Tax=Halobellus ordinarius TaxID=3075120 RepID=UPI0028805302|nr:FGGY-family carbohydrate kinase [Halobellus sp. ZY16]